MLERNKPRVAWHLIDLACQAAKYMLLHEPGRLFRSLIIDFGSARWHNFTALRRHLMSFLSNMSATVLAANHPLTIIAHNLKLADTSERTAELSMKTMADVCENRLGASHRVVLSVKRDLSTVLRRQRDWAATEGCLLMLLAQSEQTYGETQDETRRCLRRLARFYTKTNRAKLAQDLFKDILRRGEMEKPCGVYDGIDVYAFQELATCSANEENYSESEVWLKKAVSAGMMSWGTSDFGFMDCIHRLRNVLLKQEKLAEAYALSLAYPHVFELFGS